MRTDNDPGLARNPLFSFLDRQGPLLTPEQETTLGRAAHGGCRKARNELVERNMRLVIDLASRSSYRDEQELLDRIQEGSIGLMRAAEKFDPTRGYRFSTYATWWVRQAISRERDAKNLIHVPLNVVSDIRSAETELTDALGREPTANEIATEIGIPATDVAAARAALKPYSLDVPIGEDTEGTLSELIADGACLDPLADIEHRELREQVKQILSPLTTRERTVVRLRYGQATGSQETLATVCKLTGLGMNEARRIEARAIRTLQENAAANEHTQAATDTRGEDLPAHLGDSIRARHLLTGTDRAPRCNGSAKLDAQPPQPARRALPVQ